MRPPQDQVLAC